MCKENEKTKLILESDNNRYVSEMNWDANIDELLSSFYGMCVSATYNPIMVLKHMKEFAEEHLDSFEN